MRVGERGSQIIWPVLRRIAQILPILGKRGHSDFSSADYFNSLAISKGAAGHVLAICCRQQPIDIIGVR